LSDSTLTVWIHFTKNSKTDATLKKIVLCFSAVFLCVLRLQFGGSMSKNIVEYLIDRLGSEEFLPATKLIHVGIFGSRGALRRAILNKTFPLVRISTGRTLIPRQAVEDFIRERFEEAS
jgi:hypothetical protein